MSTPLGREDLGDPLLRRRRREIDGVHPRLRAARVRRLHVDGDDALGARILLEDADEVPPEERGRAGERDDAALGPSPL